MLIDKLYHKRNNSFLNSNENIFNQTTSTKHKQKTNSVSRLNNNNKTMSFSYVDKLHSKDINNDFIKQSNTTTRKVHVENSKNEITPNEVHDYLDTKLTFRWQLLNPGKTKKHFVDCFFPPKSSSIIPTKYSNQIKIPKKQIYWIRLTEIFGNEPNAFNIIDNIQEFQFNSPSQGWIDNSAVITVLSSISKNETILNLILPKKSKTIAGQYIIILNINNTPTEILIDDYIPCLRGTRCPLFCRSPPNNIWPMLIEKCLAKVYGSYYNLQSASVVDIIRKLLPLPVKVFYPNKNSSQTINILNDCFLYNHFGIAISNEIDYNKVYHGLRGNSSYLIMKANKLTQSKTRLLIKMKLPLGDVERHLDLFKSSPNGEDLIKQLPSNKVNKYNWKGRFSYDDNINWTDDIINEVEDYDKSNAKYGIFWMCYEDFLAFFGKICLYEIYFPFYKINKKVKTHSNIFKLVLSSDNEEESEETNNNHNEKEPLFAIVGSLHMQYFIVKVKNNQISRVIISGKEEMFYHQFKRGEYYIYILLPGDLNEINTIGFISNSPFKIIHCADKKRHNTIVAEEYGLTFLDNILKYHNKTIVKLETRNEYNSNLPNINIDITNSLLKTDIKYIIIYNNSNEDQYIKIQFSLNNCYLITQHSSVYKNIFAYYNTNNNNEYTYSMFIEKYEAIYIPFINFNNNSNIKYNIELTNGINKSFDFSSNNIKCNLWLFLDNFSPSIRENYSLYIPEPEE